MTVLDTVALKEDLPQHALLAGQVGTVVEVLSPYDVLIEFSDDSGRAYALLPLNASQVLTLKYAPAA